MSHQLSLGFGAVALLAGLLAGRLLPWTHVHELQAITDAENQPHTEGLPCFAPQDNPGAPVIPAGFSTRASDSGFDGRNQSGDSALIAVAANDGCSQLQRVSAMPPQRRIVLDTIYRVFPDADPEIAEIWADVYADADLAELEFILEQKRMLSATTGVGMRLRGPWSCAAESADLVDHLPNDVRREFESPHAATAVITSVRINCRSAWSVGYRRYVVLPEAANIAAVQSGDESIQCLTAFRSFEPGRMIASPLDSHVALPKTDGSLMFLLADGTVTRRGDFQILPDGRPGLATANGLKPLHESPQLPDTARNLRITATGEIQYHDTSGQLTTAGSVSVVRVQHLARLNSTDGVIFSRDRPSETVWETVPSSEVVLIENCLELSSVDFTDEARLLEQLTLATENSPRTDGQSVR